VKAALLSISCLSGRRSHQRARRTGNTQKAPAVARGRVTVRGLFVPAGPSRFKPRSGHRRCDGRGPYPTRLVYLSGDAPDLSTTALKGGKTEHPKIVAGVVKPAPIR